MNQRQDCAALLDEIRQCTHCAASLPAGPRPVLQLHRDARILIAGQAPGRKVHEKGVPFADPSGDRLRQWTGLSPQVFYDPTQIAILPMGFCYPGSGKAGDNPPRPECAEKWRRRSLEQLENLQLTLVIGRYALDYHLPQAGSSVTSSVMNWRASWPEIVPLPHPSPRNNRWLRNNPWFEAELIPQLQQRIADILGS